MLRVLHHPLPREGELVLSPEESHHLVRVRRANAHQKIEVLDGRGHRAQAHIVEAHARACRLTIVRWESEKPTSCPTTVLQAIPKGKAMDGIVQRATELGVDCIIPIVSARCEVQLDPARARQKVGKWTTIAEEAVKQCGNPWMPRIEPPMLLEAALEKMEPLTIGLVGSLRPPVRTVRAALTSVADRPPPAVALAVGPEGDFTGEEYDLFAAAGWRSVTLGPRVLRSETASCVLLALALESLREMLKS